MLIFASEHLSVHVAVSTSTHVLQRMLRSVYSSREHTYTFVYKDKRRTALNSSQRCLGLRSGLQRRVNDRGILSHGEVVPGPLLFSQVVAWSAIDTQHA